MEMQPLIVGAVAYDAKVVPIWEGIRDYFRDAPVEMDVVWFSNYEAQVEALLAGFVDVAWNTNLAYVRTHHATEGACRVLAMRDTDVGFRTLLVGRSGELTDAKELEGQTLALGSADSAQAAIMPVHYLARGALARRGRRARPLRLRRRQARGHRAERARGAEAVLDGQADAAAVGAASWDVFVRCGDVPPGRLAPFWTSPPFNHCNFTVLASLDAERADAWTRACWRWTGGSASIGGSSSSRASASGSPRSSTATVTSSRPSRNRGSSRDGDAEPGRAGRFVRRRGPRPRLGTDLRPRRLPLRRRGRARCSSSQPNPALAHELPAWCRGTGHELVAAEPDGGTDVFRIRRGAHGS